MNPEVREILRKAFLEILQAKLAVDNETLDEIVEENIECIETYICNRKLEARWNVGT